MFRGKKFDVATGFLYKGPWSLGADLFAIS